MKIFDIFRSNDDLCSGKKSYNIVGSRKKTSLFLLCLFVLLCLCIVLRGGVSLGLEFLGGTEYRVSNSTDIALAYDALEDLGIPNADSARIATVGDESLKIQISDLGEAANDEIREALADKLDVDIADISVSAISGTWGASVFLKVIEGVIVFIVLVALFLAFYFRTFKMSLASIIGLLITFIITFSIYLATGLDLTPAAVIGFLTILGYGLYDCVVILDRAKYNLKDISFNKDNLQEIKSKINLSINQCLLRSINTSFAALLPIGCILLIGSLFLGAGTLTDISLSLFIGILVAVFDSIFIIAPLYSYFVEKSIIKKAKPKKVSRNTKEKSDNKPKENAVSKDSASSKKLSKTSS